MARTPLIYLFEVAFGQPKLFMAALASVMPVIGVFLILQRNIIGGSTRSGVKG